MPSVTKARADRALRRPIPRLGLSVPERAGYGWPARNVEHVVPRADAAISASASAFFANGIDDPLAPANDNLARLVTLIDGGNPSLEPQSSENYNLGFTVRPVDKLSVDDRTTGTSCRRPDRPGEHHSAGRRSDHDARPTKVIRALRQAW